jgi:enoyl-CoA hydratase
VNIGFFPDVGATWFLPRMPGEMGTWCAVTGERLKAADGMAANVATHRVASEKLVDLLDGLCGTVPVDALLAAFSAPAEQGTIAARRPMIDRIFAADSVEAILGNLDREASGENAEAQWCAATAETIRSRSPTSLKIALRQVRKGASLSFEDCMRMEFRIVSRVVHNHDFYEGVRALLIDKDNKQQWRPEKLSEVSEADVDRYFAPLQHELALP